ncbi:unnamed protein product, partial [Chrysoparadoxa australica]
MRALFAGSLLYGAADFAETLQAAGFTISTVNAQGPHILVIHRLQLTCLPAGNSQAAIAIIVAGLGDFSLGFVDIGTHALVRAAAVQYERVVVIVDPADFSSIADESIAVSSSQRQSLAAKAFRATAGVTLDSRVSGIDTQIAAELARMGGDGVEVLVIGSGGREHAIALKLRDSPSVRHVYVAPGNGGIEGGGKKVRAVDTPQISTVNIAVSDEAGLVAFARERGIALVVVGPEVPLVAGISDAFSAAGIPCFGPSAAAARLEASKAFSKDFMTRHGIRTARYGLHSHLCLSACQKEFEEAKAYVQSVDHDVVVKASGLAAGKGVLMPTSKEEALQALEDVMVKKAFGEAGTKVVVEECLVGEEVSILALCDGKVAVCMPGAQDHKRALDGDNGLNTGGMGAYAPAPCLVPSLQKECAEICQKVVSAMAEEGTPFLGILFAGFMLTSTGPVVLEFNVRMGDPEAQVVLPLLKGDLYEILIACVEGRLKETEVAFRDKSAATVVMAAGGYPNAYPKGMPIEGLEAAALTPGVTIYHAAFVLTRHTGTKREDKKLLCNGGRVLAVTGVGADLGQALTQAYAGVEKIKFEPCHYRTDIGFRAKNAPLRIGVLASGGGTALQPVIDAIENGTCNAKVVVVVSNRSKSLVHERCARHGIPCHFLSAKEKTREEYDQGVTNILAAAGTQVVLCVGYMRVLSGAFCEKWAGRCLNVHPSLLPDFAGGMDLEVRRA